MKNTKIIMGNEKLENKFEVSIKGYGMSFNDLCVEANKLVVEAINDDNDNRNKLYVTFFRDGVEIASTVVPIEKYLEILYDDRICYVDKMFIEK